MASRFGDLEVEYDKIKNKLGKSTDKSFLG